LVGSTLAALPAGARVATGSVRRRAQLADLRPDLTFEGLRGNIPTRLAKARDVAAIVVAAVALERLGLDAEIAEVLPTSVMVPQVAQGALAIECRVDDHSTLQALREIEHDASRRAVDAERAFLAELGGDCDLPAGAHAITIDASIRIEGLLASLDGRTVLRRVATGSDPEALGRSVARHLLDHGGQSLLA
jgi:hydroxymethylbilane synthase